MNLNTLKLSATRLRECLNENCMSAQELSNRSGVSKASISQYLSGKYTPKNTSAKKLADILNVNPAWLMGLDVPKEDLGGVYANTLDNCTPPLFLDKNRDNNHAFLSEFDNQGQILSIREITPRDMGRKWDSYEIEHMEIGAKIRCFSKDMLGSKSEFEYIKEYISNFSNKELITLSKYIDFTLSVREMELADKEQRSRELEEPDIERDL